jgi:hypothetical protein
MTSFRLGLNRGSSNYSFFDPESGVSLSIGNPVGFANRITPMILRGLKYKTIIDLDNVIDLSTGNFKTAQETITPANAAVPPAEPQKDKIPNEEPPKSDATEQSASAESKAPEATVETPTEAPADETPEVSVETEATTPAVEEKAGNDGEEKKTTTKNSKKK